MTHVVGDALRYANMNAPGGEAVAALRAAQDTPPPDAGPASPEDQAPSKGSELLNGDDARGPAMMPYGFTRSWYTPSTFPSRSAKRAVSSGASAPNGWTIRPPCATIDATVFSMLS